MFSYDGFRGGTWCLGSGLVMVWFVDYGMYTAVKKGYWGLKWVEYLDKTSWCRKLSSIPASAG